MIIELINLKINNLNSISNSLKSISSNAFAVIEKYEDTLDPSLMVLPGLGNFKAGMESLRKSRLDRFIHEKLVNGSCLLGICLGMQLLGDKSDEAPGVHGLGIIKGQSIKLPLEPGERIPNVGWAAIKSKEVFPLTRSFESNKDFYFTHSYHFRPDKNDSVLGETTYGSHLIVSAVKNDRTIGVQFHPEKSATIGREFLADVIRWAENKT